MAITYVAPVLSVALKKFKQIVRAHTETGGREGKPLVVFCEDRLSLVAERAILEEAGGTFAVSVYTLSRFLTAETGKCADVLSSQGSAMAIRKLIENNKDKLQLFKRLSSASAAQEVYDTIALLYSSKISPDDLAEVNTQSKLLQRKLHDLELLYREYSQYLKDNGAVDRNAYLRRLPGVISSSEKIAGADVVFLGFQAFTSSVTDCVKACMQTAQNVYGVFIGGRENKYVNESFTGFAAAAKQCNKECKIEMLASDLPPAAEQLRRYVYEPESFLKCEKLGIVRGQLNVAEAEDEEQECQYIASQILKCVQEDRVRYREISVMLPDLVSYQPVLERAFAERGIPMYADRRYPLSGHCVCSFILDYLTCVCDGCRPESVFAVVSSPLFTYGQDEAVGAVLDKADGAAVGGIECDRDIFVNYVLRAAGYRGGVKREVNRNVCEKAGLNADAAERVRQRFMQGYDALPKSDTDGANICKKLGKLLTLFGTQQRLTEMAEQAEEFKLGAEAEMSRRAYEAVGQVLSEAEKLTAGVKISVREFIKILKSGFAAAEISLIQPKQDAVFVSDLSSCMNAGSKVVFVGGLTDAVPAASQDTAILTDGELTSLEKLKVAVSPKISQVNKRVREITALNLCAFSDKLFLSYPSVSGGEECGVSETVAYAERLFTVDKSPLKALSVRDIMGATNNFAYFYGSSAPAMRKVASYLGGETRGDERRVFALYKMLKQSLGEDIFAAWQKEDNRGGAAYFAELYGSVISPTTLETYFSCPYKAFMQQGLRLAERVEGSLRPVDSGNFIHRVLEGVAQKINDLQSEEQCLSLAKEIAVEELKRAEEISASDDAGARYAANSLVEEAQAVSLGAYRQIKNSNFKVDSVEHRCVIDLDGGIKVGGRIDRVDTCGDMVRIIDYKTGTIDDSPVSYYMGLKLQLALYLVAVSGGKRPVGAYYFPANVDYSADGNSYFTLRGFMDGSEEVVKSSDTTLQEKERSNYFGAYLNGRKLDRAMTQQDFKDFLDYSVKVAATAARELGGGYISPAPANGACDYCKYAGCCGYDCERQGGREQKKADCKTIAEISRQKSEGRE